MMQSTILLTSYTISYILYIGRWRGQVVGPLASDATPRTPRAWRSNGETDATERLSRPKSCPVPAQHHHHHHPTLFNIIQHHPTS